MSLRCVLPGVPIRFTFLVRFFLGFLSFATSSSAMPQQPGPRVELRTANDQTTFYLGERVPLLLSFTGPDDHRFQVTTASYDRSGRMSYEKFAVSPGDGWADPLERYFGGGFMMMGGLTGTSELSSKPFVLPLNLNEWVRFDKAGEYTVSVASNRAGPMNRPFGGEPHAAIESNTIKLHIVAARPEWQRDKLAAAVAKLSGPAAKTTEEHADRASAIADIRFLGTPDAIAWMAKNLRDDQPEMVSQCSLGLNGVPDSMRPAAIDAMYRQLDDPGFPVGVSFLSTMTKLEIGPVSSPAANMEEYNRHGAEVLQAVMQSLPRKNDKARVATAQTLVSFHVNELTEQQKAQLSSVLTSAFLLLPRDRQVTQLQFGWDSLNSSSFLPTLRTLVTDPHQPAWKPTEAFSSRELKAAALRRWYQLDPEGAYGQVLAEIGSANPTLSAQALWFLPDKPIPQYESLWAEAFVHAADYDRQARLGSLLVKFGTGAASSSIATEAAGRVGTWECAPQAAALAYLVKFSPDVARPLLERAAAAHGPGKTGCSHQLFMDIAQYAYGPVLTQAAIGALDEEDSDTVAAAVRYLTAYGDKTAEKPILTRYKRWHDECAGRESELENPGRNDNELWQEIMLGENLVHALLTSQGWLGSPEYFALASQLCVTKQVCDQVTGMLHGAQAPFHVYANAGSSRGPTYTVAQYSAPSLELLEDKVKQFPRGTAFVLLSPGGHSGDERAAEEEMAAVFNRQGMTLTHGK